MKSGRPTRPKSGVVTERAAITPARHPPGAAIIASLLDAARRQAEETSLDRIVSIVDSETFALLRSRLDVPAAVVDRLQRTLQTSAPWDPA